MKKTLFTFILSLITFSIFAQIENHVSWKKKLSKQEASVGEEIELIFEADIDKDWYLYSSDFDPDLGPMITEFKFEENSSYQLIGDIKPINPKRKYDSLIWDGEYTYFTKKGEFVQKVKVLSKDFNVKVSIEGQTCSDIDGKCILFTKDFTFNNLKVTPAKTAEVVQKTSEIEDTKAIAKETETVKKVEEEKTDEKLAESKPKETFAKTETQEVLKEEPDTKKAKSDNLSVVNSDEEGSLIMFMLAAFLGGLAAILTPCVFPMIPMTVSFFTHRAGKGSAIIYGISIILIYTIVGVVLALLFGATIGNVLSTHWLPNLIFFGVFLFFSLSFFGMFEIILPSKLVNNVDKQADKGGFLGPFFMALTLVLVSFSCTGPIVGSILVASAGGEILKPVAGMFAFSLAFALPFSVFAFFPSLMQKMPKSGGWLNSVKVTMGFVELALAFKFLSMADQVYHWGILDREVYIAIWIAIALCMGLYFLGYIRLPHDSKVETVSVQRLLLGVASFAFVIYLVPGMFGAPLKALSGYLPPRTTHDFDLTKLTTSSVSNIAHTNAPVEEIKHADKFEMPHGLTGYFDYEQGMEVAKKLNKPVLLDFTGHACVNCRKMEDFVWGESPVLDRLSNDYVIISLYVDDRTSLPEQDWVVSETDGKVKKTIGQVNADIQISRFNNNAQPFYVLLSNDEEVLVKPPIGYQPDTQLFIDYLEEGKKAFKQHQKELVSTIK
ncbi:protein-disulfide reductase DsbD family protein [Chondrinema litorale]|uniref:protein-disulfide reductase DsbD family protein n=1 Tax=Chondrinema litorale TaxID=2994555 RepID=UPI002542C22B|nr:LptF/LptG family permease [Chondrinema litorale]UZR94270.1 LptF/LptG family permease [Chondrinema litorale]